MEFASHGVGTAALTTGIIGTALGAFGGSGIIGNLFGGGNQYVSKESFDLAMEIARKDSEIALLKSEQNTEVKIADVYERVMTRVNQDQRDQAAWNSQQAVYNATNTAGIAFLQNQVAQLQAMTKMVIPSANVCPQPMPLYNSWKEPVADAGTTPAGT